MSMYYEPIAGFGIEDIQNYISEEKIQTLKQDTKADIDDYAYYHYNKGESKSCFYFTDNGEGHYFFMYTPSFYFKMTPQEKAFTCEDDVTIAMFESLKSVLKDKVTLETFKENITWVSTYGAG